MATKDAQYVKNLIAQFDSISDRAREEIYRKVLQHYQKNPGSPWSGAPLRDLETVIREFYADLGVKYEKEFRATLPEVVRRFYDTAAEQLKTAGTRRAILGKPDTARIKYFLESTFEQVAMRTQKMSFDHIRELRSITADVTRQMSLTGGTRREVSKELLTRALEIPGFEFIDNGGTKWSNKSYFNMLARTELMNAGRQTYFDTCAKNGSDVVRVTVSGNCCDKCARWENRLLSISGATEGLPTVDEAMADGLCHPNCTHSFVAVPDYVREQDYKEDGRPKEGLNVSDGNDKEDKPDMSAWNDPEAVKQREKQNEKMFERWHSKIEEFAHEHGMSEEQYIKAAEEKLQKLMDKASFYRRDKARDFIKILQDGRFKSQFETGTSGGFLSKPARRELEKGIWGYQDNTPDKLRPIYGTVNASPDGKGKSLEESDWYGDVICKFKSDIRYRTTFTNGDSLDDEGEKTFGSCLASEVNLTSSCRCDILSDKVKTIDDVRYGYYNEAQFHGMVRVNDIEKAFFESSAQSNENFDKIIAELKKLKIPFEIL